jgi:hypothetical protein
MDFLTGGARNDYEDVREVATPGRILAYASKPMSFKHYVNECLRIGFIYLQRRKEAHAALTEALMEHRRLTYEQCVEIVDCQGIKVYA